VNLAIAIGGVLLAPILLVWLGLRIRPAALPAFAPQSSPPETVPLPSGLPAPVERFYRVTYGETVPVIETVVMNGRGTMRIGGLPVPIRFRFTHEAGQTYRHDIEMTFLGLPFMRGYDTFIDGTGWAKRPGGIDQGSGFDQGSNVSLWAEALTWFPAVLVTDSRVRWQPVDSTTSLLVAPHGSEKEVFVVRFDPDSGRIQYTEAMKHNSSTGKKMLWINGVWFEEGRPWIHLGVEEIVYNVDVHDYIRAKIP